MAKGKDIRKDEESELVMQSNATVSFAHFCTLLMGIVQCVFWLLC